jgi:hypothetical protein
MASHRVEVPALGGRASRRRGLGLALAGVALVLVGIAIGSRIASPKRTTATTTVYEAPTQHARASHSRPRSGDAGYPRTAQGAIAAASTYVSELDGRALLDRARVSRIIRAVASKQSRVQLLASYADAASQAREQLGLGTVPAPVVIVRATPVGYRLEQFTRDAATVAIWRVGIVGSGATVQPQQSWRTEIVSLVWESGNWKVASFSSEPGPTPPLTASPPSTPSDLFSAVPRFEEFSRSDP